MSNHHHGIYNNNSGFPPSSHNLNSPTTTSNEANQISSLLRVLQEQQQQQSNAATLQLASLEPTPISQFNNILQSLPLSSFVSQANNNNNDSNLTDLSASLPLQQQQQHQQPQVTNIDSTSPITMGINTATTSSATDHLSTLRSRGSASLQGRGLTERQQFLIFVKILLKYIDRTNNPQLRRAAKAVVAECTRRNRMGDTDYMPLQAAVERRLRTTLGEVHWTRAKLCFDTYVARQGIRTVHANALNPTAISAV